MSRHKSLPSLGITLNSITPIDEAEDESEAKRRNSLSRGVLMKRQSISTARLNGGTTDTAFQNEAAAYDSVLPALMKFSRDRLPFPSCLYANNQLLVLQDLQVLGFKAVERLKGLDFQHAKAALEALGDFHGTSLAMKSMNSEIFNRTKSQIKEQVFSSEANAMFAASMENSLQNAIITLKETTPSSAPLDDAIQKIQTLQGSVFQRMVALVSPKEPFAVICHGDFWINNILFKYKSEDQIDKVMLKDLQVARYASPATDILHFLYTSTEPGLTNYHFHDLVETYHVALTSTMERLAPDAPLVTLKDVFDMIEERALYGLLMSFLLLPAITAEDTPLTPEDDVCKGEIFIGRSLCDTPDSSGNPGYMQRIRDLVLEYIDRGYI